MTIGRIAPNSADRPRRRWARLFGYVSVIVLVGIGARILSLRSFDDGPMPPALATIGRLPVTLPNGRHALIGDSIRAGVPTVITLWASWCGPCRREAPKIAELRRRFGSDALNLVYLNVRDAAASPQDRARYMAEFGMSPDGYAVLDDARIGALTNASDALIPRTLVFDRAGMPIARITGYNPLALARVAGLVGQ